MKAFALLSAIFLDNSRQTLLNRTRFFGGLDLLPYYDLHKAHNFSIGRAWGTFGGLSFFDTKPYSELNAFGITFSILGENIKA
jgi:hypothetical protein